jgi:hypothetical protein
MPGGVFIYTSLVRAGDEPRRKSRGLSESVSVIWRIGPERIHVPAEFQSFSWRSPDSIFPTNEWARSRRLAKSRCVRPASGRAAASTPISALWRAVRTCLLQAEGRARERKLMLRCHKIADAITGNAGGTFTQIAAYFICRGARSPGRDDERHQLGQHGLTSFP